MVSGLQGRRGRHLSGVGPPAARRHPERTAGNRRRGGGDGVGDGRAARVLRSVRGVPGRGWPGHVAIRLPRDRRVAARVRARIGRHDARLGRAGSGRGAPLPARSASRHSSSARRTQRGRAALRAGAGAEPGARSARGGAQSGYWGNWRGAGRLRMLFYWKVLFPALTHALGYLPLRSLTGGGDDVPPCVALEWASWGRDPDYVLSYARRKDGARGYARFTDFFQRR